MLKSVLKILLFALVGLAVAAAAHPIWLPWVLRPILHAQGIRFEEYTRDGYRAFEVSELLLEREGMRVHVEHARLPLPLGWAEAMRVPEGTVAARAEGWSVEVSPRTRDPEPRPEEPSPVFLGELIDRIVGHLDRWLPPALLEHGRIAWEGGELGIERAEWRDRRLHVANLQWREVEVDRVLLDWTDPEHPFLRASDEQHDVRAELDFSRAEGLLAAEGRAQWENNPIEVSAQWSRNGWWPESARVVADGFALPAEMLRLEGYDEVWGSLNVRWDGRRFFADLAASAEPSLESAMMQMPLSLDVEADGDAEVIRIHTFQVQAPWVQAMLLQPVQFDYQGNLLQPSAGFTALADLAGQPWVPIEGRIAGELTAFPSAERFPRVVFRLRGEAIRGYGFEAEQVVAEGESVGTLIDLSGLALSFADGSTVDVAGSVDLGERRIDAARARADLREPLLSSFLPEGVLVSRAAFDVSAQGAFDRLSHRGEVHIEQANVPGANPFGLRGQWEGEGTGAESFEAEIAAGGSHVQAAGSFAWIAPEARLRLERVLWQKDDVALLASQQEAVAIFVPGSDEDEHSWRLVVEGLRWEAGERALFLSADVLWPGRGEWDLFMTNLAASDVQDFLPQQLPDLTIARLGSRGSWQDGPLMYNLDLLGSFDPQTEDVFAVQAHLRGHEGGIDIEQLDLAADHERVAGAEGFLPVVARSTADGFDLDIRWNAPISFALESEPEAPFWERFGELTGWRLRRPSVNILLEGALANPTGHVVMHAEAIVPGESEHGMPMPQIEYLRLEAILTPAQLTLEELGFAVQGQPVLASGELPLDRRSWRDWIEEGTLPDWRKARGRVVVDQAQIAPFAQFFPDVLAPQGRLSLNLTVIPDHGLDGFLVIEDVSTRPIPPLGPVHDIAARLQFRDRTVLVEDVSGVLGGRRLALTGTADLSQPNDATFDLRIFGDNIPLAREPGLMVRADLDLNVQRASEGTAEITGVVNLRNSLFFADLAALIPGGVAAAPARRPPFFSVPVEPFAGWRLNVTLRGIDFLRVETPLFAGRFSADFLLDGTLATPIAVGRLTAERGILRFPFASFNITQADVGLSRESPYIPDVSVAGTSRAYGYEVRMEARGPAQDLRVTFSSNPPLSSEAILLMVTTGDIPARDFAYTTEQRAGKLAFFLGRSLLMELGTTNAGAERLIIRTGEHLSRRGQETYYIEYQFSDRLSIVGEYDQFDAYNAGIKWEIYSR